MIRIDPKIAAHVDAALAAGFTVLAYPTDYNRSAGHVYVYLEEDGPWALIQVPTYSFDPVDLTVPITPSKEYGSGVKVDHDGTPEDAVRALRTACTEKIVSVRFMSRQHIAKHGIPRVHNAGKTALSRFGRAAEKLGQRGSNWEARQLAGRLEVGDRFYSKLEDGRDFGILTVADRRYDRDIVVLWTKELGAPIEISERTFVILAGAA